MLDDVDNLFDNESIVVFVNGYEGFLKFSFYISFCEFLVKFRGL